MTVTVCVGSSCHLKGARKVIVRFNELLRQHGLTDRVTLKGSFCMEKCGAGVNWRIDEELLTSASEAEAEAVFRRRVLEPLTGATARPTADRPEAASGPN